MTLSCTETREARFTRVYEQHHETVRRYVWRRDPDIVDDVVAETFLVAWRRLDEIPAQAAPWLIGVARNVRRNERRGARRQRAVSVRLADAVPPLAGEVALRTLAPRDREVLLLAVWDGLDRAAIAAALGCSKANASLRVHRARRRLAAALHAIDADSNRGPARRQPQGPHTRRCRCPWPR